MISDRFEFEFRIEMLTRQKVHGHCQREHDFGTDPLHGSKLDAAGVGGEIHIKDGDFLRDISSKSMYRGALGCSNLQRAYSSQQLGYCWHKMLSKLWCSTTQQ